MARNAPPMQQTAMRGLDDLWHWNGDEHQPAWDQAMPDVLSDPASHQLPIWPPKWQSPKGWVSDASGGELWLVGDSGMVQEPDLRATSSSVQVCYAAALPSNVSLHRGWPSPLQSWRADRTLVAISCGDSLSPMEGGIVTKCTESTALGCGPVRVSMLLLRMEGLCTVVRQQALRHRSNAWESIRHSVTLVNSETARDGSGW
eukprot:COSAG02_NODE_11549_length_1701_cov_1.702871_1_plen_202_part_00